MNGEAEEEDEKGRQGRHVSKRDDDSPQKVTLLGLKDDRSKWDYNKVVLEIYIYAWELVMTQS